MKSPSQRWELIFSAVIFSLKNQYSKLLPLPVGTTQVVNQNMKQSTLDSFVTVAKRLEPFFTFFLVLLICSSPPFFIKPYL